VNVMVRWNKRSSLLQVNPPPKKNLWTLKCPRHQPEAIFTVLMKYLVESDKTSRTTCWSGWHIFQKHCSNSKIIFSYHRNIFKPNIFAIISEVEMTGMLQETQSMLRLEYPSGHRDGPEMQWNAFVMQILRMLYIWIHLHHPIWHVTNNFFSLWHI
jgi:hypothetical protein